ncbi:MAG: Fe-S cluster assembly protein SufD [Pseudolabrys sp.]
MAADIRTIKTKAEQALAETYASAKAKLPGQGAVATLREDAFQRFDSQGLPHRRVEEWKYTDLRTLMRDAKPLAAPPDAAAKAQAAKAGELLASLDCRRLIFADGMFVPEHSDLTTEKGLTVCSMADALAKGGVLVTKHVGKVFETKDPAVALNTALMGDGIVIHVAAGTRLAKPILLIFAGGQTASVFLRSLVVIEKGATATLIEHHQTAEAHVNSALEAIVADEARLDHFKITQAQGLHIASLLASVGARAQFNSFAFTPDSALVRNQTFLRYAGARTQSALGGVSLLKGKQHVDTTLLIEHVAEGCESRELYKSVLDGQSRGVFQGKIVVEPQAQKTDAKMLSNALLLSDDAEADNKPELEIFADDVQCGHGATAGALSHELLFYLRARGIPEKEAETLLIQAFIGEVIETIAHEGLREALMGAAVEWLRARE